ncbi:hypothetical protein [Sphingomonas sp. G-3-2-10]|uniref:hypothetical protein n=1 Tax=Sphingomonas sp. G-3-2-10 TaxID=2728838 RepID=UPI00146E14FC|nr:hypothetical protein [Sphingomonas sp. G-3-2-10]NML04883.1 hypothetical protein [Sphingomonas sp. G-3-2-10]
MTMGWFGNLFGGGTPEEKAVRAALKAAEKDAAALALFVRASGRDPEHASKAARKDAAHSLMLRSDARAIDAFRAIAADFPDDEADCLNQIGVCHHIAKDYGAAIENYEAAKRLGFDDSTLEENLAEARSQLARR